LKQQEVEQLSKQLNRTYRAEAAKAVLKTTGIDTYQPMDINERYKQWVNRKNRLYFASMYSEVNNCHKPTLLCLINDGLIPESKIKLFLISELYKRYIVDTVTAKNLKGDKEKTLRRIAKELHYPFRTCQYIMTKIKIGA